MATCPTCHRAIRASKASQDAAITPTTVGTAGLRHQFYKALVASGATLCTDGCGDYVYAEQHACTGVSSTVRPFALEIAQAIGRHARAIGAELDWPEDPATPDMQEAA